MMEIQGLEKHMHCFLPVPIARDTVMFITAVKRLLFIILALVYVPLLVFMHLTYPWWESLWED
jgi:hypothetical protein